MRGPTCRPDRGRGRFRLGDVVIFGAGELATLVRFHLETVPGYTVVGFGVDEGYATADTFEERPLIELDRLRELFPPGAVEVFVAIGYRKVNRLRADAYARLGDLGYGLLTFVSPDAMVAAGVELGDNCFVFEGAIVQYGARIGSDTIVRAGAVVGHGSVIGDHCFIAPRASISGNVVIGDFSFVGNNATIRDGVTIAPYTVVGAGSLIKTDTRPGEVYGQAATRAVPGLDSSELDDL
jgi:sugar O-acyltransferase (sialic acid O-acetyltransferase NeuD family)